VCFELVVIHGENHQGRTTELKGKLARVGQMKMDFKDVLTTMPWGRSTYSSLVGEASWREISLGDSMRA